MKSVKTWSTKEQVLRDLAKASGRKIKKEDIDEGYLVIGDAPPPVIVEDEDDQMQLLFGDSGKGKDIETEDATPDLLGIQQMLRMVRDYDNGDENDTGNNEALKSSDCVIAISKVSKLNPNVQEFIPKGASSPCVSSNNAKVVSESINKNVVTQPEELKKSSRKDINVDGNDIDVEVNDIKQPSKKNTNVHCNGTVDVNDMKQPPRKDTNVNSNEINTQVDEYQDMATKLKNTISVAAKSDSFEFKKQKNVAIATLLRLYATDKKSPKKNTEPLKLITPEFFEGKKDDHFGIKKNDATTAPQTLSSDISTSSTPEPKNSTTTIPTCSSVSISSTPLQTSSEETNETRSPKKKIDPEVKRSIEKVNNWFDEPTKRKSPAVCLGPIAFKRKDPKEPNNSKSPNSDLDQRLSKPSGGEGKRYQPSTYAANLGRKYMERNKVMEDKKKDVTWNNLDAILRQKDELIKKRLQEQASGNESNDESVVHRR